MVDRSNDPRKLWTSEKPPTTHVSRGCCNQCTSRGVYMKWGLPYFSLTMKNRSVLKNPQIYQVSSKYINMEKKQTWHYTYTYYQILYMFFYWLGWTFWKWKQWNHHIYFKEQRKYNKTTPVTPPSSGFGNPSVSWFTMGQRPHHSEILITCATGELGVLSWIRIRTEKTSSSQ